MNNLSLGQRLLADTPAFFKKVHFFGLMLVGLAISLAQYPFVPQKVTLIAGIVGGTLAVISLFAVKDIATVAGASSIGEGILNLVPDLLDQVSGVKDALQGHGQTLGSINTALQQLATAIPAPGTAVVDPPAPIVNAAAVSVAAQGAAPAPTADDIQAKIAAATNAANASGAGLSLVP